MLEEPTILYIEDNHDNQRLVARVLEARGYRVLLADDGPQGIEKATDRMLSLILVDMNIPTMNGYETTTRLRAMPNLHGTPIVALTADAQPGTRERTLAAGCDGYLTKPIDPRRLPMQLEEFMTGKRETLQPAQETQILREYSQQLVQRLEQQIQEVTEANQELKKLDQAKNHFLAAISHELRTPLTAILGYLDLFERGTLGSFEPIQQEAIQVITRNARLLGDQLNSLIYLQQVQSADVKRTPFLVHEVLRRVIGELEHRASEGGVALRAQIQPTTLYHGDATGVEHALRQIIDNAIKFTPAGGQVLLTVEDTPKGIIVFVKDTGIGIPDEQQENIFKPFFQIDTSMSRSQNGVGVGLAIVKHVIDAHRGTIKLRSEPGKGTLVQVFLPRDWE